MLEPHGNHTSETYTRYTETRKKGRKHTTKDNHQITREETKRTEKNYKNNQKTITKPN